MFLTKNFIYYFPKTIRLINLHKDFGLQFSYRDIIFRFFAENSVYCAPKRHHIIVPNRHFDSTVPTGTLFYYSPQKLLYRSVGLLFPTELTTNTSFCCSSQRILVFVSKETSTFSFRQNYVSHKDFDILFPTETSSFVQKLFYFSQERLRTTALQRCSALLLPTETSVTLFPQRLRSRCRVTVP